MPREEKPVEKINKEGTGLPTRQSKTASPALDAEHEKYTPGGLANRPEKPAKMHFPEDPSEAVYQARIWIAENPDAWAFMVRHALADAEAERRISLYHLVEQIRMKDFARVDGQPMKINNRIRPGLARIMAHDYPQTAPFIEFRRAACDGMV